MPVDDTHFTTFTAGKVKPDAPLFQNVDFAGKTWAEMTLEEHQDTPGDFEARKTFKVVAVKQQTLILRNLTFDLIAETAIVQTAPGRAQQS